LQDKAESAKLKAISVCISKLSALVFLLSAQICFKLHQKRAQDTTFGKILNTKKSG